MTVMSDAESRIRAALSRGQIPAAADLAVLLTELDQVRAESEARWQAIGQLAPAAKQHRSRSQERERALVAIAASLAELADLIAAGGDAEALGACLAKARKLASGAVSPAMAVKGPRK